MTVLMERPGSYLRIGGGELPPLRRFVLLVDRVPDEGQLYVLGPAAVVLPEPGAPVVRVRFDWPAPTLAEAIAASVRAVEQLGLRVLRVDSDDWVTAGDVAMRIGKSRETVRLWAAGRLGPGGFPPPVNPRRDTTFYSWAEVLPWLRGRMDLDLPDNQPELVAGSLAIQLRGLLPRVPMGRVLVDLLC